VRELETWISPTGRYLIVVLSPDDDGREVSMVYKIVTNDRLETHVDAPAVYGSFVEAVQRIEVLEREPR
jgi:hypothetical protein